MKRIYCIAYEDCKGRIMTKVGISYKEREYLEQLFIDMGIKFDVYLFLENDKAYKKRWD